MFFRVWVLTKTPPLTVLFRVPLTFQTSETLVAELRQEDPPAFLCCVATEDALPHNGAQRHLGQMDVAWTELICNHLGVGGLRIYVIYYIYIHTVCLILFDIF